MIRWYFSGVLWGVSGAGRLVDVNRRLINSVSRSKIEPWLTIQGDICSDHLVIVNLQAESYLPLRSMRRVGHPAPLEPTVTFLSEHCHGQP